MLSAGLGILPPDPPLVRKNLSRGRLGYDYSSYCKSHDFGEEKFMSILEGITDHYRLFGLRGVAAISAYRLAGRPREIAGHPATVRHPVHVRLGTSDSSVYRTILLHGEYDFDLPFTPRTIVDAGANIGVASVYYAHKYPGARIIAVEAEASNYALLSRNVAPYSNIVAVHAALWNRNGEICLSEPDASTGTFGKWGFITHEGDGVHVRAIHMRALMADYSLDSIDLLKVDIEGAEKEVFENCDWIGNVRALVVELHDRFKPGCREAVESVTSDFSRSQRGEMTLYVRHK